MARVREQFYSLKINNIVVSILAIILFLILGYFNYFYIINYSNIDIERITLDLLNKFGYDLFGFFLYGLRYVLIIIAVLFLYELFKALFYGIKKNTSFILRIEQGDLYFSCNEFLYKKRVLLSYLLPLLICGILPFILSIFINSVWLLIISSILIVANVRDIVMIIILLSMKVGAYKYKDGLNRNNILLNIRKDFNGYKNIFIKEVKLIDDNDHSNEDALIISKTSLIIILLIIIGVIVGVVR